MQKIVYLFEVRESAIITKSCITQNAKLIDGELGFENVILGEGWEETTEETFNLLTRTPATFERGEGGDILNIVCAPEPEPEPPPKTMVEVLEEENESFRKEIAVTNQAVSDFIDLVFTLIQPPEV